MNQGDPVPLFIRSHTEHVDAACSGRELRDIATFLVANAWICLHFRTNGGNWMHDDGEIREDAQTRAEQSERIVQPQRHPMTLIDSPLRGRDGQSRKRNAPRALRTHPHSVAGRWSRDMRSDSPRGGV